MKLMHRLGNVLKNEYVDKYIEQILKHPGSCDNVWIPTEYGFPPLEKHREVADFWIEQAEKFRANGISVSLQLSNTIGHGKYMAKRNNLGLVYENSPAERMVGANGAVADYCFCWRGENFKKYILESLVYYLEMRPDSVWVDDDFRPNNHDPVDFGCFCDICMKTFNDRFNTSFTRESLLEKVLHGDIKWREKYVSFLREGMASFIYEIGSVVHEFSPKTALGYQHGAQGSYSGYSYDFIFDVMKETTKQNPLARLGGHAYDDHNVNGFIEKAVFINWQNTMLPDYVKCKCPEIENLPFVAFGKSPAGTAFETSLYFANGNTDMSYSMLMFPTEPMEWHALAFDLFSKHRKYWETMSQYNQDSYQSGLQYYMSKEIWKKKLLPEQTIADLNKECYNGAESMLRDAIPISYDKDDTSLIYLHPETTKVLSDKEIEFLMDKNVVTDAESIDYLTERGYDFGLKVTRLAEDDILKLHERFTSHVVNPKDVKEHSTSFFVRGRGVSYTMESLKNTTEVVGIYTSSVKLDWSTNDESMPYGIAEAIVTTKKGAKWAILGYYPWASIISSHKRDQILNIADYISGNGLCARLITPVQAMLNPRKNKNRKTICVSVTNCTIGESGELKLLVRNPAGEKFYFMSQYNGEAKLGFEKQGEDYLITMPSLHPYSVGTIFIS